MLFSGKAWDLGGKPTKLETEVGRAAASLCIILLKRRRRRKLDIRQKLWVREWIDRRNKYCAYNSFMNELALEDVS